MDYQMVWIRMSPKLAEALGKELEGYHTGSIVLHRKNGIVLGAEVPRVEKLGAKEE